MVKKPAPILNLSRPLMSFSKQNELRTLLRHARAVAALLFALYVLAVVLIMTPIIQTYAIYAHHIHLAGFNRFDHPEQYGLALGKTVNMKLTSSDNTSLGAWFIFSDKFYRELPYPPPDNSDFSFPRRELIPSALQTAPTILYLHGNTGTRAHPLRTLLYTTFTGRLGANVLAVDYRGFGDSEGHPTVHGVSEDARAGWDYLVSMGAKPDDILIVGHSLGTAIASLLSAELGKENVRPRGTVLMAPFSSVRRLIDHYYLLGFIPLLKPLSMIPFAPRLVTWSLIHRFDTLTLVPHIKNSVLIAHADNDWDIPSFHSTTLFDAFLEPHLPTPASVPENPFSGKEWNNYTHYETLRALTRAELVSTTVIDGYGLYEEARPELVAKEGRKVAMLRTEGGNHHIGRMESVQDAMARMFRL